MKIHVCLVSAQAAANLLPALDPAIKPEKVILIISGKMQTQADNLSRVMQEAGVKTEPYKLTNEHDYAGTEAELLELASRLEQDDVALNITGGTKLVSLAAQSVASAASWRMFYVDADTDQVSWLYKNAPPATPLTQHLRLRHYLQGYGYSLPSVPEKLQLTPAQQTLTRTLINEIGSLEAPLSQLNWLSQQAEDKRRLEVEMDERQRDSRSLEALLRNFENAKSLTVQRNKIIFPSEAQRDFVKGGWLEAHVFQTLCNLTGDLDIRDSAVNLEVVDRTDVKNELDIAFMARNRLFIIECKTARMDKPEAPKANDTLFKLAETSKRIGGLGTRGMLVSYRALRDAEKQLARALNIHCACGTDIRNLSEHIKTRVLS